MSVYQPARLGKCILFEHRHQGKQPVEHLPEGTTCMKVQGITEQRAEAVPVLPCVMQTVGQEVSASALARFYTPLQYRDPVCWICGTREIPEQGDQW